MFNVNSFYHRDVLKLRFGAFFYENNFEKI